MFYKVLRDYDDGLIRKRTVVLAVLGKIIAVLFWGLMLFFQMQTCVRVDELCNAFEQMLEDQRRVGEEYRNILRNHKDFGGGGNAYEN